MIKIHCASSNRQMSISKLSSRVNTVADEQMHTWTLTKKRAQDCRPLSLSDQRITTHCRVSASPNGVASNSSKAEVGGVCVLGVVASGQPSDWLAQLCCPLFSFLSLLHTHRHTQHSRAVHYTWSSTLYCRSITVVPPKLPSLFACLIHYMGGSTFEKTLGAIVTTNKTT